MFNSNIEEALNFNYDNYFKKNWKVYNYEGKGIPRISNILSDMINLDLSGWAVYMKSIGKDHKEIIKRSTDIGSAVHNLIDIFSSTGVEQVDFSEFNFPIETSNAYKGYLKWWNIINKDNKVKVLETEKVLVSPYVGGTLDCLIDINGKVFIVDYKTSNHMNYKYFIQLAAYKYLLESFYNTHIDGVILLWLDKNSEDFREYVLSIDDESHLLMMEQCKETFLSLLYSYYNTNYLKDLYTSNFKNTLI